MTGNQSSRRCWAYQAAVGTEAIDDATDTTYLFGFPDKKIKQKVPTIKTEVDEYGSYGSRESSLTPLDPVYKPYTTTFIPTTAQYLIWMLKQVTEDGIEANVHEIEVLDTGLPLPITMRLELNEGSVDRLFQAVDCYCVDMSYTGGYNNPLTVSCDWMYGRLEDRRGQWKLTDTVSAANAGAKTITLTNTTLTANQAAGWLCYTNSGTGEDEENVIVSNTAHATTPVLTLTDEPTTIATDTVILFDKLRPKLTTAPVKPGYTAVDAYNGTPEVYWDVGDQNVQLTECQAATGKHSQNYATVLDSDSKYQTTYLYKHNPPLIQLDCILERHKQVYDYIDRKANQVNIKFYKPNSAYYILKKYYGCEIIDYDEEGPANKGFYIAKIFLKAASCIGEFTLEAETNWGTHYKTV